MAETVDKKTWCLACFYLFVAAGLLEGNPISFADFRFIAEPIDTIAVKDSPAILNCLVTGKPSPITEWKREGNNLEFLDDRRVILGNGSLYFRNVIHSRTERPDEGVYLCSATMENVGTIISRSAKLQIASLPRFDKEPEDLTTFVGEAAYFPCSMSAIPSPNITWLKNEHPFTIDQSRMVVLPSGALEIDDVQNTDAGTYQCNASHIEKFRLSESGTLIVNSDIGANSIKAPHFIATPPKSSVVVQGDKLTLDCIANGNPRPKITWLKDGSTIDMSLLDSRFRIIGVGSLHIEKVEESDVGTYMCRAENSEDSVDVSTSVNVHVPPYFVKKPENKYAYEKDDVEFECEAQGVPLPFVHWVKNGEKIIQSEYFQIVNGNNLRILGLVKSDMGIYQCLAANPAGNIQTSIQLIIIDSDSTTLITSESVTTNVYGKLDYIPSSGNTPSMPRNFTAILVLTRVATLSWKTPLHINGDIVAYSVYFKEVASSRERVVNTTRSHLEEITIQGLQPATKYVFRVVAYNKYGPGESSVDLLVETQPEVHVPGAPRNLEAVPFNSTSVHVRWEPPEILNGQIMHYKLYYMEWGSTDENEVETAETYYIFVNLKKYTQYMFWVAAVNQNGPGRNSKEAICRTYADVPSETPQNVTLESESSNSIIIRWEPPPKESQNGVITGYKIRYKLKNSRKAETVTTDGNRRLFALTNLERGMQYNVKIAALTVNGSGPATEWITSETYENDLDESHVPDQPSSLRARPTSKSVILSWGPPKNQNIMIRGYTIGWGVGVPDVYIKTLEKKQRYYTIENLSPSTEYVISLRASNLVGDGQPIYEIVKTLVETTPEPPALILPPVGLKAIVLSSSTVVLYWTDTTLSRNQLVTDNRYYTVRYSSYSYMPNPKYRYVNSTDLNCMIDDLKPNTQYEFSVKVTKGRRESTWSMSVLNTTQEAAPSSPPRDLTIVPSEDDSSQINLHWQPPKQPNGHVTGYVIFYTTDNTQKDRDWVVEGVVGNKMNTILKGLTLDTTYYFKIQARNNKGYGPLSSEISFHTATGLFSLQGSALHGEKGLMSNMLYIIIACVLGVTLIIIVIVTTIVCKRRRNYLGVDRNKSYKSSKGGSLKNKNLGKELIPPDLWIHHDQMELKPVDKVNNTENSMTITPIQRNSQDLGEPLLNTLEKRKSAYIDSLNEDHTENSTKPLVKCQIRAIPLKISLDAQKPLINNSTISNPASSSVQNYDAGIPSAGRPLYPRTQYNFSRAHNVGDITHSVSAIDPPTSVCTNPHTVNPAREQTCGMLEKTLPPTEAIQSGKEHENSGTLTRIPGHLLKSFTFPAPPPQSAPSTPQLSHSAIKAPPTIATPPKKVVIQAGSHPPDSASIYRHGFAHSSLKPCVDSISTSTGTSNPCDSTAAQVHVSCSTEKLNQEITNLEGIVKDLNAMRASEFEC